MLSVGGYPFLAYLVSYFIKSGVTDVVIYGGYRVDVIKEFFGAQPWRSHNIKIIEDGPTDGTGRGLVLGALAAEGKHVLVHGGDLVVEFDLSALVATHAQSGLDCTFVVSEHSPQNEGAFHVADDRRLVFSDEIREESQIDRIRTAALGVGAVKTSSTGCAIFRKEFLSGYDPRVGLSLEQELLPDLMCNRQVKVFDLGQGFFYEFGVPERYNFIRHKRDLLERVYGNLDDIMRPSA